MDNRLQFREGQCAERRFHHLDLAILLYIFLIYRTHHLEPDDCSPILTDNDVIDIILRFIPVHEDRSESLTGNLNRINNCGIVLILLALEAEGIQIDIFLRRKDIQKTVIQ